MEYLETVLLLSVCATVVTALSPASPSLRRAVSAAIGTVLVAALLAPLLSGSANRLLSLPDLGRQEAERGSSVFADTLRNSAEEGLRRDLADRFSLSDFDVSVAVSEGTITGVTVILRGADRLRDAPGIVAYTEEGLGVPCTLEYR